MHSQISKYLLPIALILIICTISEGKSTLFSNGLISSLVDLVQSTIPTSKEISTNEISGSTLDENNDLTPSSLSSDPDRNRNVSEIIRSRGFIAEEYDVTTADGYILTIQRIVNPLVKAEDRGKPVIMQHGLMSSSVDWVINSLNVRPTAFSKANRSDETLEDAEILPDLSLTDTQEHPNSLGFYMANRGYDVFLSNSRGNIYGMRHVSMSKFNPRFWSFTFDEQIKFDLPAVIKFVQELTNKTKVGYVGHSQGTLMMFGLLSEKPDYADIVEPFVALAPVAYCSNTISPVKYFAVYTPVAQYIDSVFAPPNPAIKYLAPIVCKPEMIKKEICANIVFLSIGFDWDELDESRADAYLGHMPAGTSIKNIAHYGQMVLNGRFSHFNHGILGNMIKYGKTSAPDYKLGNIRSKSIVLFTAENDWLAAPKDVAKLKKSLKVKPFRVFNITEEVPKWNHIDYVYGKHAGQLINTRIEKVFKAFD